MRPDGSTAPLDETRRHDRMGRRRSRWTGRSRRSRRSFAACRAAACPLGGAPFFDPRDDEVLLGYPFGGGDLNGPQGNGGMTTPLVMVQAADERVLALSSLDDRVRPKRFYFQPGETGYRVEAIVEHDAWRNGTVVSRADVAARRATRPLPTAAERRTTSTSSARSRFPRWETRPDVPDVDAPTSRW